MIIRNFEYLLALHREGHFGKAAKSCNVSQPTLSAGIKQLEEDLDVQIVRHGPRYDGLTQEGLCVLAWAKQMDDDCSRLERELSTLKKGLEGQFRLGLFPGASAVAPILSVALAERIPLLEQSIVTGDATSLSDAILSHDLDMALVYLEGVTEGEFDTHLLYRERMLLFRTDSSTQPKSVGWDDVVEMPLCLLNSAVPEDAQAQLSRCTAQTILTTTIDVLVAHVASGKYATVLPQSLAGNFMRVRNAQAVAITGPGSHANVGFIAAKDGLESPTSRALLEMVHTKELATPIHAVLTAHRKLRAKAERSRGRRIN